MGKYEANPVTVIAHEIMSVTPIPDSPGNLHLFLDDGSTFVADAGMTARYTPEPGDYLVTQEDSYQYINPKSVFERKYRRIA